MQSVEEVALAAALADHRVAAAAVALPAMPLRIRSPVLVPPVRVMTVAQSRTLALPMGLVVAVALVLLEMDPP